MESNALKKSFLVKLTKAAAGSENGMETYLFPCGSCNNEYRGTVDILEGGTSEFKTTANITIYGLGYDKLKNLSCLLFNSVNGAIDARNNVEVWIDNTLIFTGSTYFVSADFANVPDAALTITGVVGRFQSSLPAPLLEISGESNITAATAFKILSDGMALQLHYTDEIEKIICPDIKLEGSYWEQAQQLASAFGVKLNFGLNRLEIARVGESFLKVEPKKVSRENGLIGYPYFNSNGVNFKAIFDPQLRVGHYVELETDVPLAKGKWYVNTKTSKLSTLPGGKWEASYVCYVEKDLKL